MRFTPTFVSIKNFVFCLLMSGLFLYSIQVLAINPEVYDVEIQNEYSASEILMYRQQLGFQLKQSNKNQIFPVTTYKVAYATKDIRGKPYKATGVIVVPKLNVVLPMISYQHGTVLNKTKSVSGENQEIFAASIAMASRGFVVVSTDYLGLGEGSLGPHYYFHKNTQATAATDLLKVAYSLQNRLRYKLSTRLFLTGYSQGGHATVALQEHLEAQKQFIVTASFPMAGPYDLESVFFQIIENPSSRSSVEIAYLVYSMSLLHKNIDGLFLKKYLNKLPELFGGESDWDKAQKALPENPKDLFTKSELESFYKNENHALRLALKENSVGKAILTTPTFVVHGGLDVEVPYRQSTDFVRSQKNLGTKNIKVFKVNGDHETAAVPAFNKTIELILNQFPQN